VKVVIVGAGVIGASIAYRLAEAGVDVTILERGYVGSGTSSATFAWTNANRKPPRAYHDLNVAGMREHAALVEELGGAPWFRRTGNVEWKSSDAERLEQRERVERLLSWGYAAELIDLRRLLELEPEIDGGAVGDASIAYFPDEGLIDAVQYAGAMVSAARRRGAELLTGVEIVGFEFRGNRVVAAKAADGTRFEADVFVNASGRWVCETAANDPRLSIPMAPTVGYLVFTPPTPALLSRPVHSPDVSVRPDGAGRLMMRSNAVDELASIDWPADPTAEPALQIMDKAAHVLPALARLRPEAVRITIRPIPRDDQTAIGSLPGVEGYYLCVTHSGVTLAPILGRLVARELTTGDAGTDLSVFRPDRFTVPSAA
jgi:glycine/D-amino acid oxidase-like deaminating enzyme